MYANEHLIDKTVEITVAKMANCALDGKGVANFTSCRKSTIN